MKGYICDICEKFVDNPFKVHMREFVMTVDWGDGTASPSKIRNKVHMCGDCYTKFVNYIKYKSLKEKVDEQTEKAMPKGDNILKELDGSCAKCCGCNYTEETCQLCISIHKEPTCNGCTKDCPKKGGNE